MKGLLAASALGYFALHSIELLGRRNPEDVLYYYAGSWMAAQGLNPYDFFAYQQTLEGLLGGPNPYLSRLSALLYPPLMPWLFAPFAALSFAKAYAGWTAVTAAAASAACLLFASRAPWPQAFLAAALLLACPGADNAFVFRAATWLEVAAFLLGVRLLESRRDAAAGAAFALVGLHPQWLAAVVLGLALGRRWRALGWAAAINAATLSPYVLGLRPWWELAGYLDSVGRASALVFPGNLSLAAGLHRLVDPRWAAAPEYLPADGHYRALQAVFAAAYVAAVACAWRGEGDLRSRLFFTVGLAVCVMPYSGARDLLWLMPWILSGIERRWGLRLGPLAAALGATIALRFALDFPSARAHLASAFLLAAGAAFAWRARSLRAAWVE